MKAQKNKTGKPGAIHGDSPPQVRADGPPSAVQAFLKRNSIPVMVFLATFFIILTISNPAMFLTDELITANQLHQLDKGHQIITNEGKYGVYPNGTPLKYFELRGNQLLYTAMLPVLSLPALKCFSLFGDNFRLIVILLWSLVLILLALFARLYHPSVSRFRGIDWTMPAIVLAFALFLVNVLFYQPFALTGPGGKGEVAAVIFTNHILLALTAALVYCIFREVIGGTKYSLFGTIAVISSSSFLFWASNAKDHILLVTCLALVLLFFVRYISHRRYTDAVIAFSAAGLAAWARPEIAFFVFALSALFFLFLQGRDVLRHASPWNTAAMECSAILFVLLGALPFFINNLVVTGDPFRPTFLLWDQALSQGMGQPGIPAPVAGGIPFFPQFFDILARYFTVSWSSLPSAIPAVILNPATGNMSFLAVCPLSLFSLFLVWSWYQDRDSFSEKEKVSVWFIALFLAAILVAVLRAFYGMNISPGMVPDMRYLIPAYLPAGILGVIGIVRVFGSITGDEALRTLFWTCVLFVPGNLLAIMLFQPFGGGYLAYSLYFRVLVYGLILVFFAIFILTRGKPARDRPAFRVLCPLLAAPLAWQIMMVFLYSIIKFDGYLFWIPATQLFYFSFVRVI